MTTSSSSIILESYRLRKAGRKGLRVDGMFKIGGVILAVWTYCFFCQELPMKVSVAMMISGLFSMGWGLLRERK